MRPRLIPSVPAEKEGVELKVAPETQKLNW
jgi:hypothetical protein